jgi:hypothetical protein
MPLQERENRKPGRYKEKVPDSFFQDLPEEELEAWQS